MNMDYKYTEIMSTYTSALSKAGNNIGLDTHRISMCNNAVNILSIDEQIEQMYDCGWKLASNIFESNDTHRILTLNDYLHGMTPKAHYNQSIKLLSIKEPEAERLNGRLILDQLYNAFNWGLSKGKENAEILSSKN